MTRGKALLVLCGVVAAVLIALKPKEYSALERAQSDDVTVVSDDDPIMQAAFEKARDGLDEFLALSSSPAPNTNSYAVKVAVSHAGRKEYFWINPFAENDGSFSGRINNTPRYVSNVTEGQEIRFERSDIVDWTYIDTLENKTYGNFTACALLAHESEEQAAAVKKEYGLDCDS
jgi:uncharacterized protein YegJ (DUF2314 family)